LRRDVLKKGFSLPSGLKGCIVLFRKPNCLKKENRLSKCLNGFF
jgi:hypothetical protein